MSARFKFVAIAFAATMLAGAAHADGIFTFDDVAGWSPDRQAPAGFASVASGGAVPGAPGNNVLGLSLSSAGYNSSNVFYDTQGDFHALPSGIQTLSVELYVTPSMASDPNRVTGLWGQAADPNNTPIIELAAGGYFRGWDPLNGGWIDLVAATTGWNTLTITHVNGQWDYAVNGVWYLGVDDGGATALANVILQAENGVGPGYPPTALSGTGGVDATYYYDNLAYSTSATPLPAALPLFLTGGGLLGFVARRRKKAKSAAALAVA